jgi:hypothetical protein
MISNLLFLRAGYSIFTINNPKGEHYTFRIVKHNEKDLWFVGLLTAPDKYTYVGCYDPNTGIVRLTAKSRYKEDSTPVKVIRWALKKIHTNCEFPVGYAFNRSSFCCRCGRTLTHPTSLKYGIGPECAKHYLPHEFLNTYQIELELDMKEAA